MNTPAIYNQAGIYDQLLPPYLFYNSSAQLVSDEDMLATTMAEYFGQPAKQLDVLDIGAGTGRMTQRLAPYAARLVCNDKYPAMLDALHTKLPDAEIVTTNTQSLTAALPPTQQFDMVTAFWTLNYPIGEYLETVEEEIIIPRSDFEEGIHEADAMISGLIKYLKPGGGRLLTYFFDSESPEQQAVTKIWEQLAPDPGGARSFTRELAQRSLATAAERSDMEYSAVHYQGIAPFTNAGELVRWYKLAHCKSVTSLVTSRAFTDQTQHLINTYTLPSGVIELPVGMYELSVKS